MNPNKVFCRSAINATKIIISIKNRTQCIGEVNVTYTEV